MLTDLLEYFSLKFHYKLLLLVWLVVGGLCIWHETLSLSTHCMHTASLPVWWHSGILSCDVSLWYEYCSLHLLFSMVAVFSLHSTHCLVAFWQVRWVSDVNHLHCIVHTLLGCMVGWQVMRTKSGSARPLDVPSATCNRWTTVWAWPWLYHSWMYIRSRPKNTEYCGFLLTITCSPFSVCYVQGRLLSAPDQNANQTFHTCSAH